MTKTELFSALKVVGMIGLVVLVIVVGVTLLNDKYVVENMCTRTMYRVRKVVVIASPTPTPTLVVSGKVSPSPIKAASSAATKALVK